MKRSIAGQINGDIKWYDPTKKRGFVDTRWMGAVEVYPFRYKNIVFCGDYMEAIVDGLYICMCHYPIEGWNQMSHLSFMIHGHEHSAIKNHLPEGIDGKILDVSWDYFKAPLSIQEVKNIMANKNVRILGHH